jgi:hypothetical protein
MLPRKPPLIRTLPLKWPCPASAVPPWSIASPNTLPRTNAEEDTLRGKRIMGGSLFFEEAGRRNHALGRFRAPFGLLHPAGQARFHLIAQETVSILTAYDADGK